MKTCKKILCSLLVVVMCLTSAPLQGFVGMEWPELPEINFGEFELPKIDFSSWFGGKASAVEDTLAPTGQCGDNVYWNYNSTTGELVISGTGAMLDYGPTESPFYRSIIKSVIIEDGITTVGRSAFVSCYSITTVLFPSSIISIGDYAFINCENLTSIIIPDSVTYIGDGAFCGCLKLESIAIDKNNQYYSSDNYGVLFNKSKTELIQYPVGNSRESYSIPFGVTSFKVGSFAGCEKLKNIIIPESVTAIGSSRFQNFYGLTSLTIPDSVTEIGKFAFRECTGIRSVTIGSSVTTIGDYAFNDCTSLTDVYYNGTKEQWEKINIGVWNYELTDATIHFLGDEIPATASTTYKGVTATLDSAYFEKDSLNYNHELARFCSLFTVIGYEYGHPETIQKHLEDCGFEAELKNIVTNASQEQVNNFVAHKKVLVNGKEYTLVFAGYIGSHKKQWYSNFDPGRGSTHKGFTNAKNYVYTILENYIKSLGISKDETIILLTGHSRGAATSNLVAKQLIDDEKYATKENIYNYAFATPNSTSLPERKADKYKRIFNIVNPEDLVTKMIPSAWGYGRYGETYTLPSKTNEKKDYKEYKTAMNKKYKLLMDGESYHPYPGGEEQTYNVIYDLTGSVKNINQFYDKNFCWLNTWTTIQEFITNTLCTYLATSGEAKEEAKSLLLKTFGTTIINSKLITSLTNYFIIYQGLGAVTDGWVMDDYFQEAHQAETYCAYMMSMTKEQLQVKRKTYNGTVNCPVDVEIYDKSTGELVGRIVNNVVDEEIALGEDAIVMTVDGDSKSFWLPSNGDYDIKLIGNDEGTMDYMMSEIDSDIGEIKRVNFFDVEITDGLTMTADVDAEEFVIEEHELTFENGEELEPSEIFDEDSIPVYNIDISTSDGGSASSSQTAKSGDYVSLDAVAEDGWKFIGWYENDVLISTETTLAFVAKSNRILEAKFEHVDHSLCEWYEVTPATCEKEGLEQCDCSACDYSETQNVPATGHNYNNGVCRSCGDDLTANCSCNCHAGGLKGLIFKIILFFQKLFRMNRICKGCGISHY